MQKRIIRFLKKTIGCLDQRSHRSVISYKGVLLPTRLITKLEIGFQICSTKTVNRLFGIPDQKQPVLPGICKQLTKNGKLNRIGVLKFINHRNLKRTTQGFPQGFPHPILSAHRICCDAEQIIKRKNTPFTFPCGNFTINKIYCICS